MSEYERIKAEAEILDAVVTLLLRDGGLSSPFEGWTARILASPGEMDAVISEASKFVKSFPPGRWPTVIKMRGYKGFISLTTPRMKELNGPKPEPTDEDRARWRYEWEVERPKWCAKYRERRASMMPEEWNMLRLKVDYGCAKFVEDDNA